MFSDGRATAHTCARCGQALQTARSLTLQVEANVLDLCNEAYAAADASGHAHVDVTHLILVLARAPEAQAIFWQLNHDPAAMAAAANRWLLRADRRQGSSAVTASAELKALLTRAEARAIRDGRTHASLTDVVGLLAELSATGSHAGATNTSHTAQSAAHTAAHPAGLLNGLLTTSPPQVNRSHSDREYRAQTSADRATLAALLARLERQEAELAALRAAVGATGSSGTRSVRSASARSSTRGQSYDPEIHTLTAKSTADRVHMRRHQRRRQEQSRRRRNRQIERQTANNRERNSASRSWQERQTRSGQSRERAIKPAEIDRDTRALRALNAKLMDDRRIDLTLFAVGDGMTCALKR